MPSDRSSFVCSGVAVSGFAVVVAGEPKASSITRWWVLNDLHQGTIEATVGGDWILAQLRSGVLGKASFHVAGSCSQMTETLAHLRSLVKTLETAIEQARKVSP